MLSKQGPAPEATAPLTGSDRERWLRRLVVAQTGLALAFVGIWALSGSGDLFARADFTAFYAGWSIVRDGRGAELYDLIVQGDYQAPLLPNGARFEGGVLPYINPPHLTLPFAPLAWLPRPLAYLAWSLINLGLLVWLLRWLVGGLAASWTPLERRLLLGSVLTYTPLLYTFIMGTFSLVMLACLVGIYRGLVERRGGAAGAWLLLGTLKPQLVLLPAIGLLVGRHWRALLAAAGLALALAMPATLALGWGIWGDYLRYLQMISRLIDRLGVYPSLMWNLRGTVALWLGPVQGPVINGLALLGLGAAAAATVALWRRECEPGTPAFDLRFALTVMLTALSAPHLYQHDGLVLVLPAALGYHALREEPRGRRAFAIFVLVAGLVCLVVEPTLGGRLGVRLPVVAMLALTGWLAAALLQTERRAGPAASVALE